MLEVASLLERCIMSFLKNIVNLTLLFLLVASLVESIVNKQYGYMCKNIFFGAVWTTLMENSVNKPKN